MRASITPMAQLALGRIFRLMLRPEQAGDVEQYERARRIALVEAETVGMEIWARERPHVAPTGWNHGGIGSGVVE